MATWNGTKLSSWRPFYLFIVLSIVVLLFPGLLIPLWINKENEIQREVKLIRGGVQQGLVLGVEKTARSLSPLNQSAIDMARLLGSLLGRNELHFSTTETRVAPVLFQALSTIPHLSQISFIALDGLFFSYYTKGNQRFGVYSNTSFSTNYTWYIRPANFDTGKLYGEAIKTTPRRILDTNWFQNALTSKNGHASAGTGWENDQGDPLILNTVSIGTTGAVLSLGFPGKSLTNFFPDASVYGGGFYFASLDGTVFDLTGIPNTRMVVLNGNNLVSIELLNPNGDQIGRVGNLTCQANDGTSKASILEIGKMRYLFRCSPIEILGMQSIYMLALPSNFWGVEKTVRYDIKTALVLLILLVAAMVVFIFTYILLMYRAAKRAMSLYAALVKQKEATQQAERKAMNTSLAYARASHDVRASLAGITGLIEMCRLEVPPGSVLEINLRQAEAGTEDLLGMLNSVLDNSKIEAGRIQLEEEEFNMEQFIEETVDLYHPVGMKKGVDVVLDTCDGSVTKHSQVKGDRGRIKQVLSNLLSNAVKFTSEGHVLVRVWAKKSIPEIPIQRNSSSPKNSMRCIPCSLFQNDKKQKDLELTDTAQQDENRMEFIFEVNDTGKGIPKEQQKNVFENYVQVKGTASEHEGTGLGLGIVQSLVRLMGGEIAIVDKEPGERGTCFRFNIFLTVCGSAPTSISPPRDDLEYGFDSSSDSFHQQSEQIARTHSPPQAGRSQVILFISSKERSNILKKFMRRLGIQVSVVKQYQELPLTLVTVKEKLISAADDVPTPKTTSNFVLMVFDISAGPFREVSRVIDEFRRDHSNSFTRVVWIDRPGAGLYEGTLPSTDLIISKPLHGSRIYQVIGLLPEFGGTYTTIDPNTRNVVSPESTPSAVREIQEIDDDRPLRGNKFLVAEDDEVLRRIAGAILSHLGAETCECKDGKEALQLVIQDLNYQREHRARFILPFDFILMDCEMPVMGGYEATRGIREAEKQLGLHIPIIALTAHTEDDEVQKMTEAGMDYCLFKPLRQEQILQAVRHFQGNIALNE